MQDFVPNVLGFGHITHEEFVRDHTTPTAKTLFSSDNDDAAIIVMDGTYIYIQKAQTTIFKYYHIATTKTDP